MIVLTVCRKCVCDERIPNITFDSEGVCNYCRIQEQMDAEYPTGAKGEQHLRELAEKIKKDGKGRDYDCIIGVSGGCDSSYLCWYAKEKLGLRPLAAHFDNTWNSKIAVENIKNVLAKLDMDLFTYVMDNDEFNDMARSMLKSSIPNADALTDIAFATTLYMAADKHRVKHILEGSSFRTEGVGPVGWLYFDGKMIQSIHKKFGSAPMDRYPNLWLMKWMKWLLKGIKQYRPIYYMDYHKEEVKRFLTEKLDWQWYGGHHMENRFTLFNNNYLFPKKFNIDYRYIEFSALVRSGQMTREQAVEELKIPLTFDDEILVEILKRLGLSREEFDAIMALPPKTYRDYKTYNRTFRMMRPIFWVMYKSDMVNRNFYIKYTKKW